MRMLKIFWCVLALTILPSLVQAESRVVGDDPCTTQDKTYVPCLLQSGSDRLAGVLSYVLAPN